MAPTPHRLTNRQVLVPAFGPPDVLCVLENDQLPEPGPGEVRRGHERLESGQVCGQLLAVLDRPLPFDA